MMQRTKMTAGYDPRWNRDFDVAAEGERLLMSKPTKETGIWQDMLLAAAFALTIGAVIVSTLAR